MVTSGKTRRLYRPRGALALLALAALVAPVLPVHAQDLYRWTAPGSFKPISIYAKEVTHWQEQGQDVLLVRGNVMILQDFYIRCAAAVVRVEKNDLTRASRVQIYAEGSLSIENSFPPTQKERGLVELSTSGEVKASLSVKGEVVRAAATGDPLYQRARAEGLGMQRTPASGVVQASGQVGAPGSGVQQVQALMPAALPPLPPVVSPAAPAADPFPVQQPTAPPQPARLPDMSENRSIPTWAQPDGGSAERVLIQTQAPLTQNPTPVPTVPVQPPDVLPPPRPAPGPVPPGTDRSPAGLLGAGGSVTISQISIKPRFASLEIQAQSFLQPNGETAVVVNTGIILSVVDAGEQSVLDLEADRLVFWTRDDSGKVLNDLRGGQGQQHRSLEFYLAGNVEIRNKDATTTRVLRCAEAYYDVNRHVAVALKADMEMDDWRLPDPLHVQAEEIDQLDEHHFEAMVGLIAASKLPYDPGLAVSVQRATLQSEVGVRRTIFGTPFFDLGTGKEVVDTLYYYQAWNAVPRFEGVPFFYLPYLQGDPEHPIGPLQSIGLNYSEIFGFQLFTTWDVFQLVGIKKIPDVRWDLNVDYMSERGPALGTDLEFKQRSLFGIPGRYEGSVKGYAIIDHGDDQLGGGRGSMLLTQALPDQQFVNVFHPRDRGRFLVDFNGMDMPYGFDVQIKLSLLSDPNFLEQYFLREFQSDPNQETTLYVKQQQDFWAWNFLVEPNIRPWVTETEWLPKAEAWGLGLSLFDLVTYNVNASAGYARLDPTAIGPQPYQRTELPTNTGRIDLWQDFSVPFSLGPFRIVPYANFDLTYYSEALDGDQTGRIYGGGGVRASMPLSRLYPDVESEFFNLNGIFHKIVFSANFYDAYTNVHTNQLPQLDLLEDDVSDLTLRSIRPWQPIFNPAHAAALTTFQLFDPQTYALRQLVLNMVDTRDNIEEVQLDARQRWQTKRGFPGSEHVIDWMTLDTSMTLFPQSNRDNFGSPAAFLQYDWVWNIGDETSVVSNGWIDPFNEGPRYFSLGANLSRPDKTSFYLGYRQIDPLQSKAVIGSMTYAFNPKYSTTASVTYDFGLNTQGYSFMLTRTGTDLQLSAGIGFSSTLSNLSFIFNVLPTLGLPVTQAPGMQGPNYGSGGRTTP